MLKILNYNTKTFPEGCASVCGYTGDVKRFEEVQLSGFNENGDVIECICGIGMLVSLNMRFPFKLLLNGNELVASFSKFGLTIFRLII